ncbi:hypothetical protein B0H13DRAFT_1866914 [Mycena leptocephala]|nr:hypothetical protein B0H13DRAFT_1866914 [Mycena leptocephala]
MSAPVLGLVLVSIFHSVAPLLEPVYYPTGNRKVDSSSRSDNLISFWHESISGGINAFEPERKLGSDASRFRNDLWVGDKVMQTSENHTFNGLLGFEVTQWISQHPTHVTSAFLRFRVPLIVHQAEMRLLSPGLVYVRIHGGQHTFSAIGIENITDFNGEQELHFLTACGATYGLHVVGGDNIYKAVDRNTAGSAFGALVEERVRQHRVSSLGSVLAYVNGGFYNRRNPRFSNSIADTRKPEHAAIGTARASDGTEFPFLPPPTEYADKYHTVRLTGEAMITGAPIIARNGQATFTEEHMAEVRFKYDPHDITPGFLNHAEHPNPRTAIIVPLKPGRNANYHLMVALTTTSKRGAEGTGFTMVEWGRVAARLSRLGADVDGRISESLAINLDGGASTVMGADLRGRKLLDIRQHKRTETPYFVVLASKA